jgi:hypothetical protein
MTKGTKIGLGILGLLVVGVGVYLLVVKKSHKSGNPDKDDRDIKLVRTDK